MAKFPRTNIGSQSVSRMVIGTNWFLGWSHATEAKDRYIKENVAERKKIADILEVFFKAGIDTVLGQITCSPLSEAIKEAEDRTGVKAVIITTPLLTISPAVPLNGFDMDEANKVLDAHAKLGAKICMPHAFTTDAVVDKCTRTIRKMDTICKMIRDRNMIPGLSTHMPETIIFADESGLDVETYISIYNAAGFLMQVECDWTAKMINNAKKPVLTIKPMAAGMLRPFQGLNFVWNTIRERDMVALGTMSPEEAAECIEMSLSILEHRPSGVKLQETRSKASLKSRESK